MLYKRFREGFAEQDFNSVNDIENDIVEMILKGVSILQDKDISRADLIHLMLEGMVELFEYLIGQVFYVLSFLSLESAGVAIVLPTGTT